MNKILRKRKLGDKLAIWGLKRAFQLLMWLVIGLVASNFMHFSSRYDNGWNKGIYFAFVAAVVIGFDLVVVRKVKKRQHQTILKACRYTFKRTVYFFFALLGLLLLLTFLLGGFKFDLHLGGDVKHFFFQLKLVNWKPFLLGFLNFLFFGLCYFLFNHMFEKEDWAAKSWSFIKKLHKARNSEMTAKKQLNGQVAQLKQKVLRTKLDPHLFVNLFYVLSELIEIDLTRAREGIYLAMELMNDYMDISDQALIPLPHEIDLCRKLIRIQEIRYGTIFVNFSLQEGLPDGLMLPPQLLYVLVENLFKHGVVRNPKWPALIALRFEKRQLTFRTYNRKALRNRQINTEKHGLKVIKAQLDHFYPKKYSLQCIGQEGFFEVKMVVEMEATVTFH